MPAAVISVFDKIGIVHFAKGMHELGFEIISSGGTAKTLKENKIPVVEVSEYTGFPEMLDGRVKTLHPKIHGGILYKRGVKEHEDKVREHGIKTIDLVVANLYPFEQTVAKKGVSFEEIIENIDIGGPALIRAAAKNFESVGVIVDPNDYEGILKELKEKQKLSHHTRSQLMKKAFEHTASYDASIASFFARHEGGAGAFPQKLVLSFEKAAELRYGENPHQKGALYRKPGEQTYSDLLVHGEKELSFNNILDADSAFALVQEFASEKMHACVIVKHNNPCGVALANTQREAWEKAFASDTISAFGGIVAFNKPLEHETAKKMNEVFLEVVIAPGFKEKSLETLREKKNLRVINCEALAGKQKDFDGKTVLNGLLWQNNDNVLLEGFEAVTKRRPDEKEKRDLNFAWIVCKHVKSNSIVLAKGLQTIGLCGGQTNRVDCVKISGERAKKFGFETKGSVMASDAFFPFKDSVEKAVELGVVAIIQPGGSLRDAESIGACDDTGIAMVFTKTRHFRH
ncbi:MAG: bifunctional phosphoribosylaminoimidazolecarboxamide formyltransferase/IMP cyclohydrolase [Candidatus Norongarragalinales archaeon]